MRATVKGIRRRVGIAPTRKAAATVDLMAAMLMHTPQSLTGNCMPCSLRDIRALPNIFFSLL